MFGRVVSAWAWFLSGLAEALQWCLDRGRARPLYRINVGEGVASVMAADGSTPGTLTEDPAAPFDPPTLAARLAGAGLDIVVPASWLFRRDLEPVALQSLPFLDAFVRHHIERITPWRASDVVYGIRRTPLAGDTNRMAIEVGVVPRRLVGTWIAALTVLQPHRLRILPQGATADDTMAILLNPETSSRHLGRWRERIALVLVSLAIAWVVVFGWLWWETSQVQADIDEQDAVMEQRKAVLARAQHRGAAGGTMEEKIRTLLRDQGRAVDVIDALSAALPDSAHLTKFDFDKDHLTIAGISTDTPGLVPALETSRRFADVASSAPTTKVEGGTGDRFQLDMRLIRPAEGPRP